MFSDFTNFSVEIKDMPFTNDYGIVYPKTAIITFVNEDTNKRSTEILGHMEAEDIYKLIEEKQIIRLDYCYVNRFSLSEYRITREMLKKDRVSIEGLTARHAFFNCDSKIDFTFADFGTGDINLEHAVFAKGMLSLNSVNFGDGHVYFNYTEFLDGNVDFANTIFGSGEVSFKNAIFHKGHKDFQYADFGHGDVSFVNAEFGDGDVSFINTVFHEGDISFKVARFGDGKIDFHYAKFANGDIVFERAEFGKGRVDFRTVEFNHSRVNFNRTVFGDGDVTFEGSELKGGKFLFKRALLGSGELGFEQVEFGNAELILDGTYFGEGNISFNHSSFKILSLKSCHIDHYLDLRLAYCDTLDLSDTITRDIVDMKPYDFDIDIKRFNIIGMRLLGRIYLDWDKNKVKEMIENKEDVGLRAKAEEFRTLKQNFNVTGLYNDEDTAYVAFKRYEALADLNEGVAQKKWTAIYQYPYYGFKWLVFDKIGLYATAPSRVLISVVFIWFSFALVYYSLALLGWGETRSSVSNPDNLSTLSLSLYHSAVTFFTIGYGDVFPMKLSRVFSALEGFMGVFMMSYFTVAFVRKILR
jgi:uncharacterized protein YjbI with pentapeptide repeats